MASDLTLLPIGRVSKLCGDSPSPEAFGNGNRESPGPDPTDYHPWSTAISLAIHLGMQAMIYGLISSNILCLAMPATIDIRIPYNRHLIFLAKILHCKDSRWQYPPQYFPQCSPQFLRLSTAWKWTSEIPDLHQHWDLNVRIIYSKLIITDQDILAHENTDIDFWTDQKMQVAH